VRSARFSSANSRCVRIVDRSVPTRTASHLTTQIYASIRPAQLKRAVAFYEDKAARLLSG
jgi:hypothetical protein